MKYCGTCTEHSCGMQGSRHISEFCGKAKTIDELNIPKEMSYVDLLTQLKADVNCDAIPEEERKKALSLIEELGLLLWKYSA